MVLFDKEYIRKMKKYEENYCKESTQCKKKNLIRTDHIVIKFNKKWLFKNISWMCCSMTPGLMSWIFFILNWILHKLIKDHFDSTKQELDKIYKNGNKKDGKTLEPQNVVDGFKKIEIRQARLIYHVSKWLSTIIGIVSILLFCYFLIKKEKTDNEIEFMKFMIFGSPFISAFLSLIALILYWLIPVIFLKKYDYKWP